MAYRAVPQIAVDFISESEACVLRVYDDARPKKILKAGDRVIGCLTAGWGHTGEDLRIGMRVTRAMALKWLPMDLGEAQAKAYAVVSPEVIAALTEHQWSAIISFIFNTGNGVDPDTGKSPWTIWKRLNSRQFDQVPLELSKFVNDKRPDGSVVKLSGLVKRRAEEVVLWSTEEPGSIVSAPPSSVTRRAETPPTPADPIPAGKSKALLASGAAAIAGAPPMIDQVRKTIMPWAEASPHVQNMLGILATIAAICAAIGFGYMLLQKRNARN
jgi:lysozyme